MEGEDEMSRINVESEIWTDPRFGQLAFACGSLEVAIGCLVFAWKLSQEYWAKGRKLVPTPVFMRLLNAQEIIDSGLAEVQGDHVYVAGSREKHEWRIARQEAGRKGGLKSQENFSSKSEQIEATPSLFSSSALPLEDLNTFDQTKFDLEAAYKGYPRKEGKSKGMEKLKKQIKTQADYDALLLAIKNYKRSPDVVKGFVKHFSTFVSEWRDWAEFGGVNANQTLPLMQSELPTWDEEALK